MHEFINKVQKQQEEFEEFSEISVKRCVEVSPSSCQPSVKRHRVTGISGKQLVLEVEQKRDKCPETNILLTPTRPEEPMIIDKHESKLSNKQR